MPRKKSRVPNSSSPYLQMLRFKEHSDRGLPDDEIARLENRTKGHVQNLLRVARNLAPEFMEDFRTNLIRSPEAIKLAGHPMKVQRRLRAEGESKPHVPTHEFLRSILKACADSSMPGEWKLGARAALRCALGEASIAEILRAPR